KLTTRLNASSDSTCRRRSSLTKTKGRTLNRCKGIVHNRINVFSIIAKTLQLRLRSLNTSKTAKALSDRTCKRATGSNTNTSNASFKRLTDAARNLGTDGVTDIRAISRSATQRLLNLTRQATRISNDTDVPDSQFSHDLPP